MEDYEEAGRDTVGVRPRAGDAALLTRAQVYVVMECGDYDLAHALHM